MKRLDGLERRYVRWRSGSPHSNYRQPIWRNLRVDLSDATGWSEEFKDADASSRSSRKWRRAGVVGIDPFIWKDMVEQYPDGKPALIFRQEEMPLRIGYLSSYDDLGSLRLLGRMDEDAYPYPGHGLRVGRYALQFTIALAGPEGVLTPSQEAIVSQGPVDISTIGESGSNYEHMYFSS